MAVLDELPEAPSVAAVHERSIRLDDIAVAVNPVGAVGGWVSLPLPPKVSVYVPAAG